MTPTPVFSLDQFNKLASAIRLMTVAQAREIPFDANVIQIAAEVSEDVGFVQAGQFRELALNNPISLLLAWVGWVGTYSLLTPAEFIAAVGGNFPVPVTTPPVAPT